MTQIVARHLAQTYLHLNEHNQLAAIPVTETFWQQLAEGQYPALEQGKLFSAYTFDQPWPVWERHPAGDELVLLLSGEAEFLIEENGEQRQVQLKQVGDYVVVPQGLWHTARTASSATLAFMTPGEGTEHRVI